WRARGAACRAGRVRGGDPRAPRRGQLDAERHAQDDVRRWWDAAPVRPRGLIEGLPGQSAPRTPVDESSLKRFNPSLRDWVGNVTSSDPAERAEAGCAGSRVSGMHARVIHLGETPYADALALQRELAAAVKEGTAPDTVIFLEHPPVVTVGRRTDDGEVHVPTDADVQVVETDRGGRSTFHGPGQLVCYPILDLNRHGRDVRKYCRDLEEALIGTLAAFGLEGERIEGLTGVCLTRPPRKIASIGVHISRWVTTHG